MSSARLADRLTEADFAVVQQEQASSSVYANLWGYRRSHWTWSHCVTSVFSVIGSLIVQAQFWQIIKTTSQPWGTLFMRCWTQAVLQFKNWCCNWFSVSKWLKADPVALQDHFGLCPLMRTQTMAKYHLSGPDHNEWGEICGLALQD